VNGAPEKPGATTTGPAAVSRHEEVERKYDVSVDAELPSFVGVAGVAVVGGPTDHQLEATYFDTATLDLARHGMTLRRRTGGDDEGWHLKTPAVDDARMELGLPLDVSDDGVPDELLEPVRAWVRDRDLVPVARITTRRRVFPLLSDAGTVAACVTDDEVEAQPLLGTGSAEPWREWEVELDAGEPALLDAVESAVLEAGARRAVSSSKLRRALGDALPPAVPRPARKELRRSSAGELLRALLAEQRDVLLREDAAVRTQVPGGVHHLRIAARRLRSALTTYRPLIEPGADGSIREELRWLGQELAGARDAQVLREHLDAVVGEQPPELVLGPVVARIDEELLRASREGRERAREALTSTRYFRLLDDLDALVADPSLNPRAGRAARDELPHLLARDAKRLRRAARAVSRAAPTTDARDLALHEARKKAKRLRYAAESAVPALGRRAKRYGRLAKTVQQALGIHQDAVVARRTMREHGVRAHLAGENGFTFGLLYALEARRAEEAEASYRSAWKAMPHRHVRRWLEG
jgi:CHAD domain-containing protein